MTSAADIDRTRAHQRDASNPRASAWVIANAGSGKTHVLTQRVIRLLLSGIDPAAILCLTFTKVAAAEMSRRVFRTLGDWTLLDDRALKEEIGKLEGRDATPEEMRHARRLFAKALETPGGLKIQTIHAFCERLLHAFPFEANVPGQFAVMDDAAAAAALAEARATVMDTAAASPDSRLGRAVRRLAESTADMQIGEALDALISRRDALRLWIGRAGEVGAAGSIDDALADLRIRLGLGPEESEESVCRQICDAPNWSRDECKDLHTALVESLVASPHSWNERASPELAAILGAETLGPEANARLNFFLNRNKKEETWRAHSQRFGAAFVKDHAGLKESFAAEADRLIALADRLSVVRAFDATEALLVVGDAIIQAYERAKRRAGALDFNDLIAKTRNLLSRSEAAQWVLYKLDRRIEHILVDEAQDTSPDQWMVVQALAEDFFSGEGISRLPRTLFAVGDDKQSIFRFQGADPAMLDEMRRFFERRADGAKQLFVKRPLFLSFRSTDEVLRAVDTVFDPGLAQKVTASDYTAHAAHRADKPGRVVLLPRAVRQKREEPEEWTAPYDAPDSAETELAGRIADEILKIRNRPLPSGKVLRDGGILVLVRKRDAVAAAVNRALRVRQIPTAGADRIPISTHIAVLDLLALADVMLLPEDDLQLAALLKSPLLRLTEDELMRLALGRITPEGQARGSLWQALRRAQDEPFSRAAGTLGAWRGMADRMTPFRFFATVLGPEGGRRAFRARLGGEADDVLDTFLSQALAYEAVEPPSLQGFVRFVRANEKDIRRETEEGASGVRVMTVHGAKGLEADVVFLADTGGAPVVHQLRDRLVNIGKGRDDPAFLWRRNAAEAPEAQRLADAREDDETRREYLRLLYVAMTRARDVLYVCGVKLLRPPEDSATSPERTWYTIVREALAADATLDENGELAEPYVWPKEQRKSLKLEHEPGREDAEPPSPPDWLRRDAPPPPRERQPLRPSRGLAEPDLLPAVAAGAEAGSANALLRGNVVHRLLELLPAVPVANRRAAARRLVDREVPHDHELADDILAEAEAVLADPALATIFGPESRAELALVGNVATADGDYAVSGRIDRIVRDAAGWHIVDFKSNRQVPAAPAGADPAYVLQLALYRRLLQEMEPGVEVRASLVWTAGPAVMPIPAALMEQALEKLGIRGNRVP